MTAEKPKEMYFRVNEAVNLVAEEIYTAWAYFHVLQGMHRGSQAHPTVVETYDLLFGQIWRGVFNALIAAVGTLLDRTKTGISFHLLLKEIRKEPALKSALKAELSRVQTQLDREGGPLEKLSNWRHNVVGHRTKEGRSDAFHLLNKMHLKDVESALEELDGLLSELARASIDIHILSIRAESLPLAIHGQSMFGAIAESLRRD